MQGESVIKQTNLGFWKKCEHCGGSGKVKSTTGFFQLTTSERNCQMCDGKGEIFTNFICPIMSIGNLSTYAHSGPYYTDCIGDKCAFWDHDGYGGCLKRQFMISSLRGGSK